MNHNKFIWILLSISLILSFITFILVSNQREEGFLNSKVVEVQGEIKLKINNIISISIPPEEKIVFGACKIDQGKEFIILDSNKSINFFDNVNCVNGTFPDYMELKNTGTIPANITINPQKTGPDFFNDTNSWYAYAIHNQSIESGCSGIYQSSYLNLSNSSKEFPGCSNLTPGNVIKLSIRTFVTINAKGGGSSDIRFTARPS